MPGLNGIELQRRIRIERPELPVIFISAHHDDETRKRALDEGAIRFLYKPFDGAELLRMFGVNYFFALTTTISPDERQLHF